MNKISEIKGDNFMYSIDKLEKILNENILTDEENGKNIHEKTNLFMIAC